MKKISLALLFILLTCLAFPAFADVATKNVIVQESDGSPRGTLRTLKVTNGSLTDDGSGVYTLSTVSGTVTVTSLAVSSQMRNFLNSTTNTEMQANIGATVGSIIQAYDADLTTWAGLTPSSDIQTFVTSASNTTARSNLGVAIGSNVQAYDADLTTLAAPNTWKVFYSDGSGNITEVALGDTGSYLRSSGTGSAPAFVTPTIGTGNVSASSVIADNRIVRGDGGVYNVQTSSCSLDDSGGLTCTGGVTAASISTTGTGQSYLDYGLWVNKSKGSTSASDFQVDGTASVMHVTASSNTVDLGGTWDATTVSSLKVPNGTNPNPSAQGAVGVDTSDDQFQYYGSAKRVLSYKRSKCAVVEDLAAADDNMPLGSDSTVVTATKFWCRCEGTCTTMAQFSLEDNAGNAFTMQTPTCVSGSSIATAYTITSSTVTQAYEGMRFDVTNTPSPETDTYEICREEVVAAQ